MSIKYDKNNDTLHIALNPEIGKPHEYEEGDVSVFIDDTDALTQLSIRNVSRFLARALKAGVQIEQVPDQLKDQDKPTWEDVDSSMISAFKYDELSGTLEVMFHRTGVYRYFDVPLHVVEGLRDASSKGSYMRSMIIDMYPYEKGRG